MLIKINVNGSNRKKKNFDTSKFISVQVYFISCGNPINTTARVCVWGVRVCVCVCVCVWVCVCVRARVCVCA